MTEDHRSRIEQAVLRSPIRHIPEFFISSIVASMDDGSHRSISTDEYNSLISDYDADDLTNMGIVGFNIQWDMDLIIDVIDDYTNEIIDSIEIVK